MAVEKEEDVVRDDNEIGSVLLHSSDAPAGHTINDGELYYSTSPKTR